MSLPRELMLIIDDIVNQNNHLLEWEVFGNATEDMRVVLTWRRLDSKKNSPRRGSNGKKLINALLRYPSQHYTNEL